MTHDRCSELLGGYVRGELSPEDARAVAGHLSGCDACRAEEQAATALAAADVEPMDDVERARLHRGLARELFTPRANADVTGVAPRTPPWTRWVAPALAAAAVVAAFVVMTTGGGSDEGTAQLGAEAPAEGGADEEGLRDSAGSGAGSGGDAVEPAGEPARSRALEAAGQESTFDAAGPSPRFHTGAGSLTPDDLVDLGDFRSFARAYSPDDGTTLYDPFLETVTSKAGGAGREVEECAGTLPDDGTLLPVYGALGEYDERDALVLAFVTSDPGSEELDRYLIWVWARGDCSQPIDTFFERIGAR